LLDRNKGDNGIVEHRVKLVDNRAVGHKLGGSGIVGQTQGVSVQQFVCLLVSILLSPISLCLSYYATTSQFMSYYHIVS
jgi:hypothetical protein